MRQKLIHEGKKLNRQGVVVECSNIPTGDLASIVREIGLTREELSEVGFALLKNASFMPTTGVIYEKIHGESSGQHLHHDTLPQDREGRPLVFLYHGHSARPRKAWTVLGDEEQVFEKLAEYANDKQLPYNTLPIGYSFLSLHSKLKHPSFMQLFFNNLYSHRNSFVGKAVLNELYKACESVCYYHTWQSGDILLIDDAQMVHGRLPFVDAEFNAKTCLFAKTYHWLNSNDLAASSSLI